MYSISLRRQTGLTLVENMIALTVVCLVIGTGLTGFESVRARSQLEGAAAQIKTDLQHARSLAVSRAQVVRLSFTNEASSTCYVVHTGPRTACSCSQVGTGNCDGGGATLGLATFRTTDSVRVVANSTSMAFDPYLGTVAPTGTIKVTSRTGETLHLVVNVMGRVRTCTPTPPLKGYAPC